MIAALQRRFSDVQGPSTRDICYATQNRQTAVRELARTAEVIVVVGAHNSSNSNRLREIAEQAGLRSYLVADGGEIDPAWFRGVNVVGVTAGASAPEHLARRGCTYLDANCAFGSFGSRRPGGDSEFPPAGELFSHPPSDEGLRRSP